MAPYNREEPKTLRIQEKKSDSTLLREKSAHPSIEENRYQPIQENRYQLIQGAITYL